jgi:hypothetical protein
MNKLTYTICTLLLAGVAFGASEESKLPKEASDAINKAIESTLNLMKDTIIQL